MSPMAWWGLGPPRGEPPACSVAPRRTSGGHVWLCDHRSVVITLMTAATLLHASRARVGWTQRELARRSGRGAVRCAFGRDQGRTACGLGHRGSWRDREGTGPGGRRPAVRRRSDEGGPLRDAARVDRCALVGRRAHRDCRPSATVGAAWLLPSGLGFRAVRLLAVQTLGEGSLCDELWCSRCWCR